ncbi:MAG TPA: ABC transporter permease [Ferruginibacter sp.]|nr:ABC transporter permease [Ferruginibacter sp.]HMP21267.1 ABC transporter permease [Ferruginibacter sp.]
MNAIKKTTATGEEGWSLVIEPSRSLFSLRLKEVWRYRDLLLLLVRRDFVAFYKQTILGPLWFFIQPLFTTIIYTFVFGNLASISTDGVPGPLFYLAGITLWNYFAECFTKTSTVFKDNAAIFGKVYFPRLIMPLSIVCSNLVRLAVQMLLFIIALLYFNVNHADIQLTAFIFLVPLLIVQMALLGLGAGMIISALTTKYRDLSFVVTFGVQLLMYATTVIYPLSAAPQKYKRLLELNPLTPVIETFRLAFLGRGTFNLQYYALSIAVTLIVTVAGVIIFNRVERDFIDTV